MWLFFKGLEKIAFAKVAPMKKLLTNCGFEIMKIDQIRPKDINLHTPCGSNMTQ